MSPSALASSLIPTQNIRIDTVYDSIYTAPTLYSNSLSEFINMAVPTIKHINTTNLFVIVIAYLLLMNVIYLCQNHT